VTKLDSRPFHHSHPHLHMKTIVASSLGLALLCPLAHAAEVTDALVEKTLGVSGVKHTTRTQTKYGMTFSDVEYKDQKGQGLVVLRLGTAEQYGMWKQTAGDDAAPVTGVGTDAFRYKTLKAVCAKSQAVAACVTPDFLLKSPTITDAHLQALVRAALQ